MEFCLVLSSVAGSIALFWTILKVAGGLGFVIFVHELGHFLVAKACKVRVLKFSLGFGPPVGIGKFKMRWERGHTEYVVSWIPLGGFVKMLGEQLHDQGGSLHDHLRCCHRPRPRWPARAPAP